MSVSSSAQSLRVRKLESGGWSLERAEKEKKGKEREAEAS